MRGFSSSGKGSAWPWGSSASSSGKGSDWGLGCSLGTAAVLNFLVGLFLTTLVGGAGASSAGAAASSLGAGSAVVLSGATAGGVVGWATVVAVGCGETAGSVSAVGLAWKQLYNKATDITALIKRYCMIKNFEAVHKQPRERNS